MSYSFNNPCYQCAKNVECKDAQKIQESVYQIHNSNDGTHLGSGQILMMCVNLKQKNP